MHLLYCDETNIEDRQGDFLIYGGLMFDCNSAIQLSRELDAIRLKYKVPREYCLKFNPGPEGLSHAEFIELKQGVLELAAGYNVRLIVYLILHDIATNKDLARRNGINQVCYNFDGILNSIEDTGLVLIDRFNDDGNQIDSHLREKFTTGITGLPYTPEKRLTNIVGFHYSAIGQSHFTSVVDIAIGSLRFAINAHTRGNEKLLPTAKKILSLLAPLFWRQNATEPVPEYGLLFSPKVVKVGRLRSKYEGLKHFLDEAGISTYQEITDERRY